MKLTCKIKLMPSVEQAESIKQSMKEYIITVNNIVDNMVDSDKKLNLSSKDIMASLPSAVKNQAILDAKSVFAKYKKQQMLNSRLDEKDQKIINVPVLKKPLCIWNNQNYVIKADILSFPVIINGKSKRIEVKALIPEEFEEKLTMYKKGTLRITTINNKLIAQIVIEVPEEAPTSNGAKVMGIDLGLKNPAVCVTEEGKTKFVGNGRKNKVIRRKYKKLRKKLGKAKKLKKIKKINNKEQRIMNDIDHKISRQIINFAVENEVSIIRLERLANIRKTARTSRKNELNLHSWSFYRLASYIEYKAKLLGIKVEYVNPEYTSQKCPNCQKLNKMKDRKYKCSCGYKGHRDRVGAINIINAPMADCNSLSA